MGAIKMASKRLAQPPNCALATGSVCISRIRDAQLEVRRHGLQSCNHYVGKLVGVKEDSNFIFIVQSSSLV